MYGRAIAILSLIIAVPSHCIAVHRARPQDVIAKTKIELRPSEIECEADDIIIITAPVATSNGTNYQLYKPNGEEVKLDIRRPKTRLNITHEKRQDILVKYVKDNIKVIKLLNQLKIINLNRGQLRDSGPSTDEIALREMRANEFSIGPLGVQDHGNWVLSLYVPDIDGNIIEMFQVITLRLIERVPPYKRVTELQTGDTFRPGFAYRIKDLESCEVIAPESAFDRFFERNQMKLDNCGFNIPNVTKSDEGIWRIIGVGKIVYECGTLLVVNGR